MPAHCCNEMRDAVTFTCDECSDEHECPDSLVSYNLRFDEYGLIVHDGGTSCLSIAHCPWCGVKLPESKRDRWFDELEAQGIGEPHEGNVPERYLSDAWYRSP